MLQVSKGVLILLSLLLSGVSAIPLSDFYPFGASNGDMLIGRTDDGSSELITLNRVFPFYGTDHFVVVVRTIHSSNS